MKNAPPKPLKKLSRSPTRGENREKSPPRGPAQDMTKQVAETVGYEKQRGVVKPPENKPAATPGTGHLKHNAKSRTGGGSRDPDLISGALPFDADGNWDANIDPWPREGDQMMYLASQETEFMEYFQHRSRAKPWMVDSVIRVQGEAP